MFSEINLIAMIIMSCKDSKLFLLQEIFFLQQNPIEGNFDFEHLKAIHYFIFKNVYEWAGEKRTINIYKHEQILAGLSVEYSKSEDIDKQLSFQQISLFLF